MNKLILGGALALCAVMGGIAMSMVFGQSQPVQAQVETQEVMSSTTSATSACPAQNGGTCSGGNCGSSTCGQTTQKPVGCGCGQN